MEMGKIKLAWHRWGRRLCLAAAGLLALGFLALYLAVWIKSREEDDAVPSDCIVVLGAKAHGLEPGRVLRARLDQARQAYAPVSYTHLRTLAHLPSTVEYILIPLILRTTKVAEELSASMTVRGVRFSGETVSYRAIRFTWKDAGLCALMLLISGLVFSLERGGVL